jgi:HPt (histidine-containing phosphotransfer) domain-containing protein
MPKAPTPAELAIIDPDGSFRQRLARDRDAIAALIGQGADRQLETIVHRLAGAATTFGYEEIGTLAIALDDAFIEAREQGRAVPDVAPLLARLTEVVGDGR